MCAYGVCSVICNLCEQVAAVVGEFICTTYTVYNFVDQIAGRIHIGNGDAAFCCLVIALLDKSPIRVKLTGVVVLICNSTSNQNNQQHKTAIYRFFANPLYGGEEGDISAHAPTTGERNLWWSKDITGEESAHRGNKDVTHLTPQIEKQVKTSYPLESHPKKSLCYLDFQTRKRYTAVRNFRHN